MEFRVAFVLQSTLSLSLSLTTDTSTRQTPPYDGHLLLVSAVFQSFY